MKADQHLCTFFNNWWLTWMPQSLKPFVRSCGSYSDLLQLPYKQLPDVCEIEKMLSPCSHTSLSLWCYSLEMLLAFLIFCVLWTFVYASHKRAAEEVISFSPCYLIVRGNWRWEGGGKFMPVVHVYLPTSSFLFSPFRSSPPGALPCRLHALWSLSYRNKGALLTLHPLLLPLKPYKR